MKYVKSVSLLMGLLLTSSPTFCGELMLADEFQQSSAAELTSPTTILCACGLVVAGACCKVCYDHCTKPPPPTPRTPLQRVGDAAARGAEAGTEGGVTAAIAGGIVWTFTKVGGLLLEGAKMLFTGA